MTHSYLNETAPVHWLLRITARGFKHDPLYIEVADPHQPLGNALGPAWEALHLDPAATVVTQHGKTVDLHLPVGHLPFTPFFARDDKWGVIEVSLKPLLSGDSVEVSVCGNLPVPESFEPSFHSDAFLSKDLLLACVEEALVVKALSQKSVFKHTIVQIVLETLLDEHHVEVERDRVLHAIDDIVRKFNLATSAQVIHLANFQLRVPP